MGWWRAFTGRWYRRVLTPAEAFKLTPAELRKVECQVAYYNGELELQAAPGRPVHIRLPTEVRVEVELRRRLAEAGWRVFDCPERGYGAVDLVEEEVDEEEDEEDEGR